MNPCILYWLRLFLDSILRGLPRNKGSLDWKIIICTHSKKTRFTTLEVIGLETNPLSYKLQRSTWSWMYDYDAFMFLNNLMMACWSLTSLCSCLDDNWSFTLFLRLLKRFLLQNKTRKDILSKSKCGREKQRINLYNNKKPRFTFFFNKANFLRRYSSSGVRLGKPMARLFVFQELNKTS